MYGGIRIATVAAMLTTSCASPQPDIKVRAAGPAKQSIGVEEAEAHLALGNIGLALEGFRKAAREQPNNARVLAGIARSYDRMGRFDLSRRWFETALAAAPLDGAVLLAFAASLDQQGLSEEAASLRLEAVQRTEILTPVELTPARAELGDAPAALSVQPEPADQAPVVPVRPNTRDFSVDQSIASAKVTLPPARPSAEAVRGPAKAKPAQAAVAQAGASVTLSLPPPRPFERPATAVAGASADRAPTPTERSGPRLERLSFGQVALVTRPEPIWNAEIIRKSPGSVTFRFGSARPLARLLNAARKEGLAARTRARLIERGWRRVEIGDAPAVREKTLVLYPQSQRFAAQRLASQFGFSNIRSFDGSQIIVLLGRDAARLKVLRPT